MLPEYPIHPSLRPGPAGPWLAIAYAALVVYGTLFPIGEWAAPPGGWTNPITAPWPQSASRADLLVNVLAYIPLGLFVASSLRRRARAVPACVLALTLGSGLSFSLETLQSALPSRVPSPLDWIANTAGTAIGALIAAMLDPRLAAGRRIRAARHASFESGILPNLALAVVALWTFTQIAPFVPSPDVGNLRSGLKPIVHTLQNPSSFHLFPALETALQLLALGLLVRNVERRPRLWPFAAFSLAVLLYKVPVVGRQLTLEALTGWTAATLLLAALPVHRPAGRIPYAIAALLIAHVFAQLEPGTGTLRANINWIPFGGQIGTLGGMLDILETLWPFMALGLMARWSAPWRWREWVMLGGGVLIAAFTFALEWAQQSIPGRFADVTDVFLAVIGWLLPWTFRDTRIRASAAEPAPEPYARRPARVRDP